MVCPVPCQEILVKLVNEFVLSIGGEHRRIDVSPYDGKPKDDLRESTERTGAEDKQRVH